MECTFAFPVEQSTLLAKFEAIIDGKVVQTRVIEKEHAKIKYEDAVASGKAAVIAER